MPHLYTLTYVTTSVYLIKLMGMRTIITLSTCRFLIVEFWLLNFDCLQPRPITFLINLVCRFNRTKLQNPGAHEPLCKRYAVRYLRIKISTDVRKFVKMTKNWFYEVNHDSMEQQCFVTSVHVDSFEHSFFRSKA